jgi:hypothetical protein
VIARKNPRPGAQLPFTDTGGHRSARPPTQHGQLADLELCRRYRARCEYRIHRRRQVTSLRNLPLRPELAGMVCELLAGPKSRKLAATGTSVHYHRSWD